MKWMWFSTVVVAFAVVACAQDSPSLGEVARQNQEQKRAKHTFTNDDVKGSTSEGAVAPRPVASTDQTKSDNGESKSSADSSAATDDESTNQTKPDRSNIVGDIPGYTPEPKDRIETLKVHALQWEAMISNFEKKIAAETNPEKRESLETMLEHARQNQAKDAAEQQSLEKSEAEKAEAEQTNGQASGQSGQPEQTAQPQ